MLWLCDGRGIRVECASNRWKISARRMVIVQIIVRPLCVDVTWTYVACHQERALNTYFDTSYG